MNFINKLRTMLYGLDEFGKFLLMLWAILCAGGNVFKIRYLILFSIVIILYAFFRMASPNKAKRYYENQKFLKISSSLTSKIKQYTARKKDKKNNYFKCPDCKQIMCVPKGVGKVMIVCRVCKKQFIRKSR